MRRILTLTAIILFSILFLSALPVQAQAKSTHVAVISVKNLDSSPQFDYLGGMIQGLLLYDFTRATGVSVIERSHIDTVINEQQLQSTGIINDPASATKVGKLLGVQFLVFCEYVVMGQEALVTVKIISVETGKVSVFTERGRTENIIHLLAEKSCDFLTGSKNSFRSETSDRSLISMKDKTPGSITLYSNIIRAEIFLDNEFAGYTKGNAEIPTELDKLKPGPHTVRVHLGRAWGVIDMPRIRFRDWEETVNVQPGKRHAIRDRTRDFNGQLYDLIQLNRIDINLTDDKISELKKPIEVSFPDRDGKKVSVTINIQPDIAKSVFTVKINYNGQTSTHSAPTEIQKDNRFVFKSGKIQCDIRIDTRRNPVSFTMYIERTDIWQGMFDEEKK
jgi:TolB-like protein